MLHAHSTYVYKSELDGALVNEKYDGLRHKAITFTAQSPAVAASAVDESRDALEFAATYMSHGPGRRAGHILSRVLLPFENHHVVDRFTFVIGTSHCVCHDFVIF
jgi:hypothetical protein